MFIGIIGQKSTQSEVPEANQCKKMLWAPFCSIQTASSLFNPGLSQQVNALKSMLNFSNFQLISPAHIDTRVKLHHFKVPNQRRKKLYERKNSEGPLNPHLQIWVFLVPDGSNLAKSENFGWNWLRKSKTDQKVL